MTGRNPIASPRDDYYQGRGTRPSDVDLGKSTGGSEAEIRRLMLPQANHGDNKDQTSVNRSDWRYG